MNTNYTTQRHPGNTNLSLTYESMYGALPLMEAKGPFAVQYLDRLYNTLQRALADHPRHFAVRFDLRFPDDPAVRSQYLSDSSVIKRFCGSLKAKIAHDRARAQRQNGRAHDTTVRYVWSREYSNDNIPHYHFLLLLNRDAYWTLGRLGSEQENMANRIESAWASALGLLDTKKRGLIHFCENGVYRVDRAADDSTFEALFHRASYLCKAQTKHYGDHSHAFGASRK